jgi:type VI secretion system protein ImpF
VARSDRDVRISQSVLDRLIDQDPKAIRDVLEPPDKTEQAYRRSVLRDLEVLLNTRNPFFDLSNDFAEVAKSSLSYGLPDFTAMKVGNPADQQRLRQLVETALKRFEPRLQQLSVTVSKGADAERSVHLRVDAKLDMTPAAEPISFDIVMPVGNQSCRVNEID